jgi:GNAT superfamily N-acetyltransferase
VEAARRKKMAVVKFTTTSDRWFAAAGARKDNLRTRRGAGCELDRTARTRYPSVMGVKVRRATEADLPRIHEVRHGTAENRLTDLSLVTDAEVAWYLNEGVFLVSEDEWGVQGFTCANPLTGYVWALFVIDGAQGRGHGTALIEHAIAKLRSAGHRQAFLTTDPDTRAARFYHAKGWRRTGIDMRGEAVFRLWL